MAWISVVAGRPQFVRQSSEHRAMREANGIVAFDDSNLVWSWLAGSEVEAREEEQILMHPKHLTSGMVARPSETLLVALVASVLLRQSVGEDVDAELVRLAGLKGYKQSASKVAQATLRRLLGSKKSSSRRQVAVGYPQNETDFEKFVDRTPAPLGAQVALVPDGRLWARIGASVAIPLAYEALVAGGSRPDLATLGAFIRSGADFRKRVVVYERTGAPSSSVWREDTSEVPGFDAVELTDAEVVVHHYMGVRWQAPLLFDDEVNAFRFLAHIEAGWSQVREASDAAMWRRLEKARKSLRTVHRVSIDPENAMEDPDSTARAQDTYGVEIEIVGFIDA